PLVTRGDDQAYLRLGRRLVECKPLDLLKLCGRAGSLKNLPELLPDRWLFQHGVRPLCQSLHNGGRLDGDGRGKCTERVSHQNQSRSEVEIDHFRIRPFCGPMRVIAVRNQNLAAVPGASNSRKDIGMKQWSSEHESTSIL